MRFTWFTFYAIATPFCSGGVLELTAEGNQFPRTNIATSILIFASCLPTVSTKALAGAKSLGGFLYSAVNKAGKTVVEASAKIKKTVEENVSFFLLLSY